MTSDEEAKYSQLLGEATLMATNIATTDGAFWKANSLGANYNPEMRGELATPVRIPAYHLDETIVVRTGEQISQPGIYASDVAHSSLQFLTGHFPAPKAIVLRETDSRGFPPVAEKVDCVWRKVVRSIKELNSIDPTVPASAQDRDQFESTRK